jgi:hypothetical protein
VPGHVYGRMPQELIATEKGSPGPKEGKKGPRGLHRLHCRNLHL